VVKRGKEMEGRSSFVDVEPTTGECKGGKDGGWEGGRRALVSTVCILTILPFLPPSLCFFPPSFPGKTLSARMQAQVSVSTSSPLSGQYDTFYPEAYLGFFLPTVYMASETDLHPKDASTIRGALYTPGIFVSTSASFPSTPTLFLLTIFSFRPPSLLPSLPPSLPSSSLPLPGKVVKGLLLAAVPVGTIMCLWGLVLMGREFRRRRRNGRAK